MPWRAFLLFGPMFARAIAAMVSLFQCPGGHFWGWLLGYLVTWLLGCVVGAGVLGKGVGGIGYWVLGIGRGAVRRALGGGAPNFLTS